MSEDIKHNILFVINDEQGGIKQALPEICSILVKKHHDIHVIYPEDVSEEFEVSLRKVPWIHAQKLSIDHIFSASQFLIPLEIRNYLKRHEYIDVIHSFGIMPGALSCIGKIGSKAILLNTPDEQKNEDGKKQGISVFQKFIADNISYIFNRLYSKIIFASEDSKAACIQHISYKNLQTESLNVTDNPQILTDKLLQIYSNVIQASNK